jgi:hypothetical protein
VSEQQPLATLSALAAHNAVGGLVQMYAGVVADYERAMQLAAARLRAVEAGANAGAEEVQRLRDKLKEQEGVVQQRERWLDDARAALGAGEGEAVWEAARRVAGERDLLQRRLDEVGGKEAAARELGTVEREGGR